MKIASRPAAPAQLQRAHQAWERGVSLSRKGQWLDALAAFEAALVIAPKDGLYLVNAARAAFKCGKHEETVSLADRALSVDPSDEIAET